MFNGSSHVIIQGGTFIVVSGNMDRASLEAMGLNNPALEESTHAHDNSSLNFIPSHGQRSTIDQSYHRNPSQEEETQESCKPQGGLALRSCSAQAMPTPSEVKSYDSNFSHTNPSQEAISQDSSKPQVHPARSAENFAPPSGQVPEHVANLNPTSTVTSIRGSRTSTQMFKSIGAAERNTNVTHITPSPFQIPNSREPQYAVMHTLGSNKPRKRQPEYFQFGAGRRSCRPVRTLTYPFSTPSSPIPIPQLVCGPY